MEQAMWIDEGIAAGSDHRAVMKDRALGAGLIARAPSTTPTRRIRRAQNSIPAGLAALDLREARALLRYKDLMLRAVARAGDDAMLAADALRMERDAAHEECARLAARQTFAPGVAFGSPTITRHKDGRVSITWASDAETAVAVTRGGMDRLVRTYNALVVMVQEAGRIIEEHDETIAAAESVAARLVQVICKDAERLAHVRSEVAEEIAAAIEERADDLGPDEAAEASFMLLDDLHDYLKDLVHGDAAIARQVGSTTPTVASVPMDSDRASAVEQEEPVVDAVIHCPGCFCPAEPDTVATLRLWERQRVREALHEAGMHEAAALVAVLRHEATR